MEKDIIVGLCLGHNPSIAIIKNGSLVFAFEQEKVSHIKNQHFFIKEAVKTALDFCKISPKDITAIGIHADPNFYAGLNKQLLPLKFELAPWAYSLFLKYIIPKKFWLRHLGFDPNTPVVFQQHHKCHAAEAFFQSVFKDSAVLVLDGRGENESTSVWNAKENTLTPLYREPPSVSVGYFYLIFTSFLGFKYGDEYKVMGLASYGKPIFKDRILKFFELMKDEKKKAEILDDPYLFDLTLHCFSLKKITKPPSNSLFSKFVKNWPLTFKEKADIAASLQTATEDIVLQYIKDLKKHMPKQKNICLSGGVAQNSVLNGRIALESGFDNVFISSCPNDAGTAVGAAILTANQIGCKLNLNLNNTTANPFLGPNISNDGLDQILDEANVNYKYLKDPFKHVAKLIFDGEFVGVARGRAEFGPRALGNRSIIANPSDASVLNKLNMIKGRESFRPLAPSVKAEHASRYFFCKEMTSPYMSFVFKAKRITKQLAPAIVHVDGSCRVQTVKKTFQPDYWHLLDCFESYSGFSILLNTSLNLAGDPLVATEKDALSMFKRSKLKYLLLGDYLVEQ